jgi:hypothetical protein
MNFGVNHFGTVTPFPFPHMATYGKVQPMKRAEDVFFLLSRSRSRCFAGKLRSAALLRSLAQYFFIFLWCGTNAWSNT